MNKLEQLARKKFGGNLHKTFDYLFKECSHEIQEEYTEDITPEQVYAYTKYLELLAKKNNVDLEKIVKEEYDLASISMTKEEVMKMESNPFKAKLGKDLLKFVALNAGIASLYLISSSINTSFSDNLMPVVLGFSALMNTSFSFDTVKDMLNYFKFKKLKKQYEKENNTIENKTQGNSGRGL